MRAIYLENGQAEFRSDFQLPPDSRNLIDVRVLKAGVCETDLQLIQGYMDYAGVLGHEFVGIAESGKYAGQRVVGEINCACHECRYCDRKMPRHCSSRTVIGILGHHGAFADVVRVPEENLHRVPDSLSDEQAVFTEPVAAACRILEQLEINRHHEVVIFGAGRLGNLCAQVLRTTGCRLTVVGKHQWKLDRLQALDIATCLLSDFDATVQADITVDCTGSVSGFEWALKTVRPCGTVIQKTTVAARQQLQLAPVVIDEVTVLGSRCGPFEPALRFLSDGSVRTNELISKEFDLEEGVEAIEHAQRRDTLKVLLNVTGSRN